MDAHPAPREILSPEEYTRYRGVRVVVALFIAAGIFSAVMVLVILIDPKGSLLRRVPQWWAIAALVFCGTSLVGGFGAWYGWRWAAALLYVPAFMILPFFPAGPLMSIMIFGGLRRYLIAVRTIQQQTTPIVP